MTKPSESQPSDNELEAADGGFSLPEFTAALGPAGLIVDAGAAAIHLLDKATDSTIEKVKDHLLDK